MSAYGTAPITGPDLAAHQRRLAMLQLLRTAGRIDVASVAETFDVARETVRRDLKMLEREGRLERVHGGAVASQPVMASSSPTEGDSELGRRLWRWLPRAGTMIIGNGRAGCMLADAILADPPESDVLTIVTSSLDAAISLSRVPQLQVYNLGGTIQPGSHAQQGNWTIEELRRIRCDVSLIMPDGVDAAGGLTSRNPMTAAVAEAESAAGTRVFAVADEQSLGRTALVRFAGLDAVSKLIVTGPADEQTLRPFRELGVDVICLDATEV